jgi:hypothetical protein
VTRTESDSAGTGSFKAQTAQTDWIVGGVPRKEVIDRLMTYGFALLAYGPSQSGGSTKLVFRNQDGYMLTATERAGYVSEGTFDNLVERAQLIFSDHEIAGLRAEAHSALRKWRVGGANADREPRVIRTILVQAIDACLRKDIRHG